MTQNNTYNPRILEMNCLESQVADSVASLSHVVSVGCTVYSPSPPPRFRAYPSPNSHISAVVGNKKTKNASQTRVLIAGPEKLDETLMDLLINRKGEERRCRVGM